VFPRRMLPVTVWEETAWQEYVRPCNHGDHKNPSPFHFLLLSVDCRKRTLGPVFELKIKLL
jgi:hypothetical protein